MKKTIPFQLPLRREINQLSGSLDFREQRALFQRIDSLLAQSGVDADLVNSVLRKRHGRITCYGSDGKA
ncbi:MULTISPECIES: hypothetical protein [unclassified Limnospira]|uniref:hypothetical protein n=1 Tax=unclassified Limnospira TaxID=2642885 RepID=UPI0028E14C28|nr:MULTISPECIES: hypothetical protein [unclassified Limnospira]MDT9201378.1 hypothetical protein [Limnospira sp. PMC 1042.18]MDT9231942.1 hypothetical protein [Limnospira sp. PMC 1242.20]MDT9293147.1 hypothetical protein [Limnospira sp. PMC 1295.21]